MTEPAPTTATQSRRALLLAAAGAAGAVAATMAVPAATLAADPNDVVKDTDNATTALTSITQGTTDTSAFQATATVRRRRRRDDDGTVNAGVVGLAGDASGSVYATQPFDIDSGVYGYANQTGLSSGLVGEGPTGVYAFGDVALWADGATVGV